MNVKIEGYDYHSRMLFDIARRKNAPMVLLMMIDKDSGKTLRCANGNADDVVFLMGCMCAELAKQQDGLSLEDLLAGLRLAAKAAEKHKGDNNDDKP